MGGNKKLRKKHVGMELHFTFQFKAYYILYYSINILTMHHHFTEPKVEEVGQYMSSSEGKYMATFELIQALKSAFS